MASSNMDGEDDVSMRPMRLKVLYTFDDENKTNHLARWPDALPIQTVSIDKNTVIGVIESHFCIRAIVDASPELVTRAGQDYTVYAYDYSEYDNPLVSQGMLSKVLATATIIQNVPKTQSKQLLTGRVCKNVVGIFANGVKETLEVKLRLVPVPATVAPDYMDAMARYRESRRNTPISSDSNGWNSTTQSNSAAGSFQPTSPPILNPNQRNGMSTGVINQITSPQIQQQLNRNPFDQCINSENSGAETRDNAVLVGKTRKSSITSTKATVKRRRGRKPKFNPTTGGNTSGYEECTDGDDGPVPKKRAKVQKADRNSSTTVAFGPNPDCLRVAAGTSGSLRLFRPIAMSPRPEINHIQNIPRAPTPIPIGSKKQSAQDQPAPQTCLRRNSRLSISQESSRPPLLPENPEDRPRYSIESVGPSPERNGSPCETLPEICSSPPVMGTPPQSHMRSSPPCQSSPVLPQMPRTDSGFMSGSLDDLFGDDDEMNVDNEDEDEVGIRVFESSHPPLLVKYPEKSTQEVMVIEERPGPMDLLPTKMPKFELTRSRSAALPSITSEDGQTLPPLKNRRRAVSPRTGKQKSQLESYRSQPIRTNSQPPMLPSTVPEETASPIPSESAQALLAPNAKSGSGMIMRTASLGTLTLPNFPASDASLPSSLQQSSNWAQVSAQTSDIHVHTMPKYSNHQMAPDTEVISTTANSKKIMIKQKLEKAIANGEMPPFCCNCGAIETPTWRKAWSKELQGEPGYYEYSDEPGRVTAIIILTRDADGKPTSYHLVKKYLAPDENQDEYQEYLLCNPCGIWMSKYKTSRPEERWENKLMPERPKKRPQQRMSKPRKYLYTVPNSDANFPPSDPNLLQSETNYPPSDAYFPQNEVTGGTDAMSTMDTSGGTENSTTNNAQRRGSGNRAIKKLYAMISESASDALKRAIQSSPAKWAGTQHSPINVDDELGSTRRLLFPSPRKDGSPIVLGEATTNVVQIADVCSPNGRKFNVVNKENCLPAITNMSPDAEMVRIFGEEISKDTERPKTPVQKSPALSPFKTPTRPTPNHKPATRSLSRSSRSVKSPGQLLIVNRTPKTPGSARRRSPRNHGGIFESPFTATLNKLMAEATKNHASPSSIGIELDYGCLPALPEGTGHVDMNYSLEELFPTQHAVLSSPSRMNLSIYEDPMINLENLNWEDFGNLDANGLQIVGEEGEVKERQGSLKTNREKDDGDREKQLA